VASVLTTDLAHAVYSGNVLESGVFRIQGEIEGTAFALTSELFVTAGHVARTLADSSGRGGVNITAPEGSRQSVAVVLDSEEIGSDMALLRVEHLAPESVRWVRHLRWAGRTLGALEPVATIGYPYGFYRDAEPIQIVSRAFSGHVVAALKSFKPMGSQLVPFPVYELSFGAPRGLSGAPLFSLVGKELCVNGVVIGNSKSSMLILAQSVEETESRTVRTEHYESLSLGLASQVSAVFAHQSRILGATIGHWLTEHGLLAGT